jgi:hypothetical protein
MDEEFEELKEVNSFAELHCSCGNVFQLVLYKYEDGFKDDYDEKVCEKCGAYWSLERKGQL